MNPVNAIELLGLCNGATFLRNEELNNRIFYLLRKFPDLDDLTDAQLVTVCKQLIAIHLEANDVLFKATETNQYWYILLTGSLLIDGALFYPYRCIGNPFAKLDELKGSECFVLEPTDLLQAPNLNSFDVETSLPSQLTIVTDFLTPTSPNSSRVTLWPSLSGGSSNSDGSLYSGQTQSSSYYCAPDSRRSTTTTNRVQEDQLSFSSGVDVECRSTEFYLDSSVMEYLMKPPEDRNDSENSAIADAVKNMPAFSPIDYQRVKLLCSKARLAVVPEVGQCVLSDSEQLAEWCVLLKGSVEIRKSRTSAAVGEVSESFFFNCVILNVGDSFGVKPSYDTQYQEGIMKTITDDCRFLCVCQFDYTDIVRGPDDRCTIVEDQGRIVVVRELLTDQNTGLKRDVIMKATPDKLIEELIAEENPLDPTYVEDFIMTHRVFLPDGPLHALQVLLRWFQSAVSDTASSPGSPARLSHRLPISPNLWNDHHSVSKRIINVVIKWAGMHFNEFENSSELLAVIYKFAELLEDHGMTNELYRLYDSCSSVSKQRQLSIIRADKTIPIGLSLVGGQVGKTLSISSSYTTQQRHDGVFISSVEPGSLAEYAGARVGDEILEVNNRSCSCMAQSLMLELINQSVNLNLLVRTNLTGFYRLQHPESFPSLHHPISRLTSQLSVPECAPMSPLITTCGRSASVAGQSSPMNRSPPPQHRLSECASTEKSTLTSTSLKRLMMKKKSGSLSESSFDKQQIRSRSAQNSPNRSPNRPSHTMIGTEPPLPTFSYTPSYIEDSSFDSAPRTIPIEVVNIDECGGGGGMYRCFSQPSTTNSMINCSPTDNHPPDSSGEGGGVLRVYHRENHHVTGDSELSPSVYVTVQSGATTATEVIVLALLQLGVANSSRSSSDYLLCEVSLEEPGPLVKTRVLKNETCGLVSGLKFNCRYYLKNRHHAGSPLMTDADVQDLINNQRVNFLDLSVEDVTAHLFSECFVELCKFRPDALLRAVLSGRLNNNAQQSKQTEISSIHGGGGGLCCNDDEGSNDNTAVVEQLNADDEAVDRFLSLSNRYLYWVMTEICMEKSGPSKRSKIIKRFIRIAKLCRDVSNIEGFFAIINALESGPVKRLKSSWEKVPGRDIKMLKHLGALLDLSGNMRILRGLHDSAAPPIIPMASLITKDLAVLHESLPTRTGDDKHLVHFNKLRMMAGRCRHLVKFSCSGCMRRHEGGDAGRCRENRLYNYALSVAMERLNFSIRSSSISGSHEEPSLSASTGRTPAEWWRQSAATLVSHVTQSTATMRLRRRSQASISSSVSNNSHSTTTSGSSRDNFQPRRLWEEQQRARRVRHYLSMIQPVQDENLLRHMSFCCESSGDAPVDSLPVLHRRNKSFDGLTGSRIESLTSSETQKISQILANAAANRAMSVSIAAPPMSPSTSRAKSQSGKKLRSISTVNQPNLLKLFSSDNRSFDQGVQLQRDSRIRESPSTTAAGRSSTALRRQSSLIGSISTTKNDNGSSCSSGDSGFPSDSPRQIQIERQGYWPSSTSKTEEPTADKHNSVVEYCAKL